VAYLWVAYDGILFHQNISRNREPDILEEYTVSTGPKIQPNKKISRRGHQGEQLLAYSLTLEEEAIYAPKH
jgi:hypothetical protein